MFNSLVVGPVLQRDCTITQDMSMYKLYTKTTLNTIKMYAKVQLKHK